MKVDHIRRRVYKLDALINVLKLACLQIDRNDFADVLQEAQETNWEVHNFLEEIDSGNTICALTIVPKDPH